MQRSYPVWTRRALVPRIGSLLLVLALFLAACGDDGAPDDDGAVDPGADPAAPDEDPVAGDEDYEPITLRVHTELPPVGFPSEMYNFWADQVTERTDGRVTFEFFWSSELVAQADLIDSLEAGVVDMGAGVAPRHAHRTPHWELMDLPYNVGSNYYCGTSVTMDMLRTDPVLSQEMEDASVVPLLSYLGGTFHIVTREAVDDLSDLEGARYRVYNDSRGSMWDKLGLNSLILPFTELYEGLDRGVVDGVEWPLQAFAALGLWEITDHIVLTESGMVAAGAMLISADVWEGLPASVRTVMLEAAAEHDEKYAQDLMALDAELLEEFQNEHGMTVRDLSADEAERLRAAGADAADEWLQEAEGRGLDVRDSYESLQAKMAECEARVEADGFPWEG